MKEAEFAPLVEEFMIKHGASLSLPVEVRIVMAIGSVVSLAWCTLRTPIRRWPRRWLIMSTHRRHRPALARAFERLSEFALWSGTKNMGFRFRTRKVPYKSSAFILSNNASNNGIICLCSICASTGKYHQFS